MPLTFTFALSQNQTFELRCSYGIRRLDTEALARLINLCEEKYYTQDFDRPAELKKIGRELYQWLDGKEAWLRQGLEEDSEGRIYLDLIQTSEAQALNPQTQKIALGLAHLPWELLHNGSGFLLREANVLPVRSLHPRQGNIAVQSFPSIFFELINQPPETANTYQFSSVEVKQLAFRIDGIFLPKSNPSSPIYFVEVQFQPDKKFYSRLFTEIFLYLDKTELTNNWRGVVVYPRRSTDVGETQRYIELLTSGRITRIYLDELDSTPSPSIAIGTVKLVVEPESSAVTKARELINLAKQQIASEITQREFLELIETIIVYKFPQKSREEIEQMFGFSELKQTKVYQEAKQEGKLEAVPLMLNLGATVEQIAEALGLDVELVRLVAAKVNTSEEKSTSG